MLGTTDGKNDAGQPVGQFDAPDLTPEALTEHTANVIASALEETHLVEIREIQANQVNQVHILCRVQAANAKIVAQNLVDTLLTHTDPDDSGVEAFIGKQFLRKKNEKTGTMELCFAWVFSFAGEDLNLVAHIVCDAISEACPRQRLDVMESPLMGPGTPRSAGRGSKGASPIKASG